MVNIELEYFILYRIIEMQRDNRCKKDQYPAGNIRAVGRYLVRRAGPRGNARRGDSAPFFFEGEK